MPQVDWFPAVYWPVSQKNRAGALGSQPVSGLISRSRVLPGAWGYFHNLRARSGVCCIAEEGCPHLNRETPVREAQTKRAELP